MEYTLGPSFSNTHTPLNLSAYISKCCFQFSACAGVFTDPDSHSTLINYPACHSLAKISTCCSRVATTAEPAPTREFTH